MRICIALALTLGCAASGPAPSCTAAVTGGPVLQPACAMGGVVTGNKLLVNFVSGASNSSGWIVSGSLSLPDGAATTSLTRGDLDAAGEEIALQQGAGAPGWFASSVDVTITSIEGANSCSGDPAVQCVAASGSMDVQLQQGSAFPAPAGTPTASMHVDFITRD